jgi:cellulose synthase/poly-beta-1,6-N-acetylglucosamine synthase-like glycosyltransferase
VTLNASLALSEQQPVLPTVSVVVPIYNGEADIAELLPRLLAQTYPGDRVEFLLVDNGSRDRTLAQLQAAAAAHPERRLLPLSYTAVQSSYAARNAGVWAASSELIAFTDADCYPAPNWLMELVLPFADQAVGAVAGEVSAVPGGNWLERYAERKQILSQKNTLNHPYCPYGQTANLAVRAAVLRQIGLFRPYLTSGGDADLCWRLQQAGWQLAFAEKAAVQHHHRRSLVALRQQWHRYGCSNRYLHQLYGVDLMRPLRFKEIAYRLSRWLLKELPASSLALLQGQADAVDLVLTPLDLVCFWARTQGQQVAQLPALARQIERLETAEGEP